MSGRTNDDRADGESPAHDRRADTSIDELQASMLRSRPIRSTARLQEREVTPIHPQEMNYSEDLDDLVDNASHTPPSDIYSDPGRRDTFERPVAARTASRGRRRASDQEPRLTEIFAQTIAIMQQQQAQTAQLLQTLAERPATYQRPKEYEKPLAYNCKTMNEEFTIEQISDWIIAIEDGNAMRLESTDE